MKKRTLLILSIFLSMTAFSQTLDYKMPLPENTTVKKGVLANGMTYYIYPTKVVKDAASYYIISNAGSILENEDQQGLAHFLEHMAFNGTKNFPKKGVLDALQKYGAIFGKDINAHTNFDETVYNMNNIPTKNGGIDTALLILHDWANEISLVNEEIDAERAVILEEKRTRDTGGYRILINSLDEIFIKTKYANRLPIGTEEILTTFKYQTLKDFYHDWYRTDLQAIAIIGDVAVNEIEKKIKTLFSKIPAVKNPKERYYVTIPENKKMLYNLSMDKEVSSSSINYSMHFNKNLEGETIESLKTNLINGIITSILNKRLSELIIDPKSSTLTTFTQIKNLSRTENNFTIFISPKPNQQKEAFQEIISTIVQAQKFGFTPSEVEREIAVVTNFYENKISQKENINHAIIENYIEKNYLENQTFTDIEKEYEIAKKILNSLTPTDIINQLNKLYTKKNRVLIVNGVESEENMSKTQAIAIIEKVETDPTIKAYVDDFSGKSLMNGVTLNPGKIVSEKEIPEIEATTFTLSNGIKVHYKFYNKEPNKVDMLAFSFGGLSLVKDEDLPSANSVTSIAQMSGIGEYTANDLMKVMAGKTAFAGVEINKYDESIKGSSTTKDVETLLQLTHLRFVKPRFDEDSYKVYIHNQENMLQLSKTNLQLQMIDSITINLFGKNDPKNRIQDQSYINEIKLDKIKELYSERYSDPSGFDFFITGDIKKEKLKPLLEKYIASLPTQNKKETWKNNQSHWLNNNLDKDVYLKMENPKTSVYIKYKNQMDWTPKNRYLISVLKDILNLRFTATLREEEGGTYGANAMGFLNNRPVSEASLLIMFDANPEKAEKLISIVHKEINKIKDGKINTTDFNKTIINYKKSLKERKEKNNFAQKLLYNYFIENYNLNDPKNGIELINSLTENDLQEFTSKFLNNSKSYEIVFKAKK